jgi:hypothetical protein
MITSSRGSDLMAFPSSCRHMSNVYIHQMSGIMHVYQVFCCNSLHVLMLQAANRPLQGPFILLATGFMYSNLSLYIYAQHALRAQSMPCLAEVSASNCR